MRFIFGVILTGCIAAGFLGTAAQALDLSRSDMAQMRNADIVILGENHDNAIHHEGQAALIKRIQPKAVVFEMLTPLMATQVNAYAKDDLRPLGSEIGWEAAGWPDFAIYLPVFEALGTARAVGAALPRNAVREAFEAGAAAVFEGDAARFGLQDALPEEETQARQRMQFDAHCAAMPLDLMGGMVEAQRLRDAHFAARTLLALDAYGGPVVVITGNGHARKDWGMPHALAVAAPDVTVFSVGFVEDLVGDTDARFDLAIPTEAAPRGDPCAAFAN